MTSKHDDAVRGTLADLAGRHSGRLGVAARNLTTGEEALLDADEVFPTASVIKLQVLVELMRQATGGQVSLGSGSNCAPATGAAGRGSSRSSTPAFDPRCATRPPS